MPTKAAECLTKILEGDKTVWAFLAGATMLEPFFPPLSIPVTKRRAQDPLNLSRTSADAGMRNLAISFLFKREARCAPESAPF